LVFNTDVMAVLWASIFSMGASEKNDTFPFLHLYICDFAGIEKNTNSGINNIFFMIIDF
jgi:hypothetical protein